MIFIAICVSKAHWKVDNRKKINKLVPMHVTLIHKYIYVYTYIHRVKSLFFCAHTLYILWMKESTFLIYITTHSLINNIWIHIFQNANFTRHEYMTFTKVLSWAQEMNTYVTSKIKSKTIINIYIYTKAKQFVFASRPKL